jgi:hypothetical protein
MKKHANGGHPPDLFFKTLKSGRIEEQNGRSPAIMAALKAEYFSRRRESTISPLKNAASPEFSNETPGSKGDSLAQTRDFQRAAMGLLCLRHPPRRFAPGWATRVLA